MLETWQTETPIWAEQKYCRLLRIRIFNLDAQVFAFSAVILLRLNGTLKHFCLIRDIFPHGINEVYQQPFYFLLGSRQMFK